MSEWIIGLIGAVGLGIILGIAINNLSFEKSNHHKIIKGEKEE